MAERYLERIFEQACPKESVKEVIRNLVWRSLTGVMKKISENQGKDRKKIGEKKKIKDFFMSSRSEKIVKRFSPKKYQEDFREKAEENRIFAMKLLKEQKERKNRQQKREEHARSQVFHEHEHDELAKRAFEIQKIDEKKGQIEKMMEKSRKRKEKLLYLREIGIKDYQKVISATPLYKKIEFEFIQNVEMPELQKRKEELRRKRELFRPIDGEDLRKHSHNHDSMLSTLAQEKKKSGSHNSLERQRPIAKSKALKSFLAEEKQKKIQKIEENSKKERLINKKKQYSEIVKEVFQPVIDPFKQQEMELIKARLENPVVIKHSFPISSDEERSSIFKRSFSLIQKKKKKKK